jgi:hypothetical protein
LLKIYIEIIQLHVGLLIIGFKWTNNSDLEASEYYFYKIYSIRCFIKFRVIPELVFIRIWEAKVFSSLFPWVINAHLKYKYGHRMHEPLWATLSHFHHCAWIETKWKRENQITLCLAFCLPLSLKTVRVRKRARSRQRPKMPVKNSSRKYFTWPSLWKCEWPYIRLECIKWKRNLLLIAFANLYFRLTLP